MKSWSDHVMNFDARLKAQRREEVRQYLDRIGHELAPCRRSLLPRAYCGGCFRGQHDREFFPAFTQVVTR